MRKINTFFLRVASRCNMVCDYCYVFRHRDMSWKLYPKCMTKHTIEIFARRLRDYVIKNNINEVNIIFHGGEPLIIGEDVLIEYCDKINDYIDKYAKVFFSLQTNGTLISEKFLKECVKRNIGISLSIDGPKEIHDKNRRYASGEGTFSRVIESIELLKKYPQIFEGVIGVIDPFSKPSEVLGFFNEYGLQNIDLLLPDSTYLDLPKDREKNESLYSDWLTEAFNSWFNNYQNIHFRTFEYILSAVLGIQNSLDAFGLGELDYLTIETDGSYHTSDILKITYENASALGMNLNDSSIEEALENKKVKEYNRYLLWDNLPEKCKKCEVSNICGGGSLAHRYSIENGFNNPTVYCNEMYELINYAKKCIEEEINKEIIYDRK